MTEIATEINTECALLNGGTGKHSATDARDAFAAVHPTARRRAYFALIGAGITMAFLLLTRLLWLFEPILDKIYFGTLSEILYYIMLLVFSAGFVVFIDWFAKKYCGVRLFSPKKEPLGLWRTLAIVGIAAAFVFVVSAALGFKFKAQREMGMGVTMNQALTNIAVYFYYAAHIWLGFIAAALVQYGASTLLPTKYTVPWGSIFLVAVFGAIEFMLEHLATDHLYTGYYFMFTFAYAIIYALSARRFHVSYWASMIVMVL